MIILRLEGFRRFLPIFCIIRMCRPHAIALSVAEEIIEFNNET